MKYTKINKKISLELSRLKREPFDPVKCMRHPSYFAYHFLGITPYTYQHEILRRYADGFDKKGKKFRNDRIIICKSRQIGLSICLAILAIWYASYNKANGGKGTAIHKNTKVVIVSKGDEEAKKLMGEIQNMIWLSNHGLDKKIKKTDGKYLNKSEIHFEKGYIKCYPPTGKIRGNTVDLLLIDEAAFVDGENFKEAMKPTVSKVDGKIIVSSTPKGCSGFFYELFDPDDRHKNHEFLRYWFPWKICKDPIQLKFIKEELKYAKETGNMRSFQQEYMALFTADEQSFFEMEEIQEGIDKSLSFLYECKNHSCSIAIDFGGKNAQTAIVVVAEKEKGLQLVFKFAQVDFDENLLMDEEWENSVPNLMKRFDTKIIVIDQCPQSTRTAQEMKNKEMPLHEFNFISDAHTAQRNRGYYLFKASLKQGKIKFPECKELIKEMLTLEEVKSNKGKYMKIKAPLNYPDDLIDSFMMACYPFLSEEAGNFSSKVISYDDVMKKENKHDKNPRFDRQWASLQEQSKDAGIYDFLIQRKGRPKKIQLEDV